MQASLSGLLAPLGMGSGLRRIGGLRFAGECRDGVPGAIKVRAGPLPAGTRSAQGQLLGDRAMLEGTGPQEVCGSEVPGVGWAPVGRAL